MNRYAIIITLLVGFSSFLYAGSGTTGGQILLLHSSAESAALGDSIAGIYGNIGASQYNPATLPGIGGASFELSHMLYFLDTYMTSFSYGQQFGRAGAGVRVKQFRSPDEERDFSGKRIRGYELVFTQYSVSAGVQMDPQQSLGVTANMIVEEYPDNRADAASYDFGWSYLGDDGTSYALTVRNVGRGIRVIDGDITLPLEAAFAGMHPFEPFRFTWEVFRSAEYSLAARSGLQLSFGKNLSLRLGLKYEGEPAFSSGFGLSIGNWVMDYAFSPNFEIGFAHRVSMGYRM